MEPKTQPIPRRSRGRPATAPNESESRFKLMRAGLAAFTERGYHSVVLEEILQSSGVAKGGFYHYFNSKADFGMALIEEYDRYFAGKLKSWFDQESLPPIARFQGFLQDAKKGMEKHAFRRGCLIGNLGQEMNALPENFRIRLIEVFEHWQNLTAQNFKSAQKAGEFRTNLEPSQLASFFWIGWEGAILRAKLEQNAKPIDEFTQQFLNYAKKGK